MRDIQRLAASATATLMFLGGTVVLGFPSTQDPEASDGNCVHKFPVADEVPHPVTLEPRRHVVRRSPEHQLRVKVFYDETVEQLPKHKRKIVEKVVPAAVGFWERALKVRRMDATVRLNRKCENNQYFLSPGDPTQFCKNRCVETKCGEFVVPEEHLTACSTCNSRGRECGLKEEEGEGVDDVDFLLYVSARDTKQCGGKIGFDASTVAYAAHCQQESSLDRPVAGHTNICPGAIKNTTKDIESLSSTIKHELLHALGFSSSLFAFFRDKDGEPLTEREADGKPPINRQLQIRQWSNRTIKRMERPWNVRGGTQTRTIDLMVTPRVVEEVRRHFNCSDLEGAELEDQGGDGTALTHWEKRIFQNEAMTGTVHTENPVYSRLTFALLEDSGWYLPNYDLAEDLTWGKNLGCDFARLSCKDLIEETQKGKAAYPFCSDFMDGSSRTFCTADKKSVGSCNMVKFSRRIPKIYRNFNEVDGVKSSDLNYVGSTVTLADFCPYVQEFTWKSNNGEIAPRGTRCTASENQPDSESDYALENYGEESRCFEQGSKWNQKSCNAMKQWRRYGAGCYNYRCEEGRVHIVVRNVSLACDLDGQEMDVRLNKGKWLHEGTLVCPKCSDYCGAENCDPSQKSSAEELASLMEDIDEDACFGETVSNGIRSFLQNFGLSLGG